MCVYVCVCVCVCVRTCVIVHSSDIRSCLTLCEPMTVAHQAPLSIAFSRQEYWSGLPFPAPGYLPDPGSEPAYLESAS